MRKLLCLAVVFVIIGCSNEDDITELAPPIDPPAEELPVAVDDEVTTIENSSVRMTELLTNDTVYDYARITNFDSETEEGGTVVDNRDGSYTYNPPQDFIGEDTFTYTLCDNASTPNCSTATVNIQVTAASPVAVDDAYETGEDEELIIKNHLSNDTVVDNAAVTSIVSESGNAVVTLENDGSIKYIPNESFAGEDTFKYYLCDDDEEPTCSTATITITVVDEGSPVAVNDEVVVDVGATGVVFSNLLSNDYLTDDAVLTSIDAASSNGTVVLNNDGTVTYSTATGFKGEDSFTYEICDDDSPNPTCSTATVAIFVVEEVAFNIPADLQDYYSEAILSQNPDLLKSELANLTEEQHVNKLEYYMRHDYLYDADASFSDPEYVVLMYTGELRHWSEYQEGDVSEGETFNTEHIYPQSRLASQEAKNDMHLMRVADIEINEARSYYPFTEGSGDAKLVNENSWYPGDEWKGDVARIVLYVHLKYGEPFSDVGNLEMFLKWNVEDPVSAFEMQRQEIIEGAQGNRNPFIDNPYFATLIWDGPEAENLWE
ncbi:Ig-like domain-containing protein [Salinimicrobium terrae]|uniref:Ig-like domain-containing protein n=1 Tax=Salinimicrobium terrae TaxID=470866 RepID=UPI000490547D|nr:Ig-like domain-containing protein [Salinimicrobium terrae]